MPEVIINDEAFMGEMGETLIDVARRNGAHVGFTCNDRGICTFCECVVEEGAELLNPVTGNEKTRLSEERLEKGSRLTCRAVIKAPEGTIRIVTRPEVVKKQLMGIFYATSTEGRLSSLSALGGSLKQASADYLSMYPYVFKGITSGKMGFDTINPLKDIGRLVSDGGRVLTHQLKMDKNNGSKKGE
jgi:chlorosome envelope protein I